MTQFFAAFRPAASGSSGQSVPPAYNLSPMLYEQIYTSQLSGIQASGARDQNA